jgi:hypothetical protein
MAASERPAAAEVAGSVEMAAVLLMREAMGMETVTKGLRTKENLFALYRECLAVVRSPAPPEPVG